MSETTVRILAEGWTWIVGSPKWHYIRNGMSLCGRWAMFATPSEGYEVGNDNSKDNCKTCAKKIMKEKNPGNKI